jgi:hypothetical protein
VTLPSDVAADLEAYVDRHPEASVAQVLGHFVLDPAEHAAEVADRLGVADPTADADGQQATLATDGGVSGGDQA